MPWCKEEQTHSHNDEDEIIDPDEDDADEMAAWARGIKVQPNLDLGFIYLTLELLFGPSVEGGRLAIVFRYS